MKDKEFFSRVPGLAEPWRVKEVRLDLEARRVDVEIECRAGEVWAGQDYISCAVDIDGRRVLEVVAGRTQEAAAGLLRKALPGAGARAGVRAACIDMWAAFEAAVGITK